ncbi:MAG: bifunctional adenosylcobinamide kinase/adenosylcobinamide-phosphate guanylyltransferase [Desulfohalobiaceae bacterium]|nr:bifunctional adenosylcobinamide kinase/adenosylcobinamide-phosphate guanylyltransferase [Desulfohalobiaceae bacterium]
MAEVGFVLGGCRSGKSGYAQKKVLEAKEQDKIFLATCAPRDDEMRLRVERHRLERGDRWRTVEEGLLLEETVQNQAGKDSVLLVDCLGMWVSNLLGEGLDEAACRERFTALGRALERTAGPVWLVSNEVGCGIVPGDAVSRSYRDLLGMLNQEVAGISDRVVWMVAGLPVEIKGDS